ncbi:tripartite motif-containing protein 45-like [Anneissia japonica]|uniref:tripartite motif-containing protein 45-like n=1 Tax=Anneissia japonica TaxID=1529436 RepID=UPI00142576BB|nr:tripartite motif-containing protein 45-like [Anneissia japonica]
MSSLYRLRNIHRNTTGIDATALECFLCTKRFTNPKSLPCIHSFCLGCLDKLVKESNGKITCPICFEVCEIPTGGLKKLQDNIFINGLLDHVTKLEQKSAPTCGCKKEASFSCRDCDELYCGDCKDAHKRMKIAKDHSIITMKEYNTIDPVERLASKPVICSEHTMPLQFYCESHKIPVCVGCTQVQHPRDGSHEIIDIKDAFKAFSENATEHIETADKTLLSARQMVEALKEKKEAASLNYSKCKKDIIKQTEDLYRLIRHHKEEQLQNLEESHKQKMIMLESQVSKVESSITKLSSMRGITDNLTKSPNKVMALMNSSVASEKLTKLLLDEDSRQPQELPTLNYNLNSRLSQSLDSKVVERLRGEKTLLSPNETTIEVHQQGVPSKMARFLGVRLEHTLSITTRNALGDIKHIIDAKVKCLGIDRKSNNKIIDGVTVTDEQNGYYHISSVTPFTNCTIICLIIDRSNVYVNTIEFDKHGKGSTHGMQFKPF